MKTNNEVTRTQGEWKTIYKYEVGINHSLNTFADNVQTIAFCDPMFSYSGDDRTLQQKEKEAEANAAYIVKAVNLHSELIEALKEMDNTATLFADDHKHYYEKNNQNRSEEHTSELQ